MTKSKKAPQPVMLGFAAAHRLLGEIAFEVDISWGARNQNRPLTVWGPTDDAELLVRLHPGPHLPVIGGRPVAYVLRTPHHHRAWEIEIPEVLWSIFQPSKAARIVATGIGHWLDLPIRPWPSPLPGIMTPTPATPDVDEPAMRRPSSQEREQALRNLARARRAQHRLPYSGKSAAGVFVDPDGALSEFLP